MSGNFGFDVENVFGSARKGTKRKSKRKKDSVDMMMDESLSGVRGIDTFSLAEPKIDALGIGSDFGDVIGSRAGRANGKQGGFLDIIGQQQSRVRTPAITGRGKIARGRGRKVRPRGRTPLQRSSGSRFGDVDRAFAGNVIGNIRGAKKRISAFREKCRKSKTVSTEDQSQLPFNQRALTMDTIPERETPALEDKSSRSAL